MFTCRKHSPWRVPGGEAGSCPGKMNILPCNCKCFAQETQQARRNFCQQHMPVFSFHVKVEVLHVTTVYLTYECRVTQFHINRALVCPGKASNSVNRLIRLHINRPQKSSTCCNIVENRIEQCCAAHIARAVVKNPVQHCYTRFRLVTVLFHVVENCGQCRQHNIVQSCYTTAQNFWLYAS